MNNITKRIVEYENEDMSIITSVFHDGSTQTFFMLKPSGDVYYI